MGRYGADLTYFTAVFRLQAVARQLSAASTVLYGNFDIILDNFFTQFQALASHAPYAVLYLVPMLIVC